MSRDSTPSPPKPKAPAPAAGRPSRAELEHAVEALQAENVRLREISLVDMLTGLHNYRYFLEQIDIEMERVRRTGAPCALLMLDIDLFKRVNDTHGHEAGNAVLREVARVIKASTRVMDVACRYGGEEFAVILPATDLAGAVRIAERIRRTLKRRYVQHADVQVQVTISAGAACFGYLDSLSRAEFIELADAALYKAKRGGRDRVCSTGETPATEVGLPEKEMLK
jgi:two-component system cell cycle response regulator